ncbi:MAG: hypothetical protein ACR2GY_13215 [Phycisphaerales bacterium]
MLLVIHAAHAQDKSDRLIVELREQAETQPPVGEGFDYLLNNP